MSVGANHNIRDIQRHRLLKDCFFLIEGIPLYVNYHNKTNRLLRQKHNDSIQFLTPYYGHKKCYEFFTVGVFLT